MLNDQYNIRVSASSNLGKFLTKLKSSGTKVSSITVIDDVTYFRTNKKGVKQVRKYRRRYGIKVKITTTGGDPGLQALFKSYRYVLLFLIPLVCSFFLWSVNVESDVPEVAERIEAKLNEAEIVPFRLLSLIPDEGEIRRSLMQDDPSLSWVRFKKEGTSLTVIPMLSPASNIKSEGGGPPSDLIARTGGVITRFELTKGERVGNVFSTVRKGDLLATGSLEQGDKKVFVGAEGAVYADYWIEYSFSLPKTIQYKVQGEERVEFVFHPPWIAKSDSVNRFWNIISTERTVSEEDAQLELEEGMEETVILPLVKNKLLGEHGSEAVIKDNKILHVTFDNDKVNGTILFLMNDNIAIKRPISQGD